jgi:hypothetical protein
VVRCRLILVCALAAPLFAQTSPDLNAPNPNASCCSTISPDGHKLIALLDSLDVEHHWLPHESVHWQNGDPGPHRRHEAVTSHCSAFAAAVSLRLHVYLLRPPQHETVFLASAQGHWLAREGQGEGWVNVDATEAQRRANLGQFVVVDYISPIPHKPGHIAVIRPAEKTAAQLAQDGPEDTQAGGHNHNDYIVARSFNSHAGAWPDGVRFYAHPVDWAKVTGRLDPADMQSDSLDGGDQP